MFATLKKLCCAENIDISLSQEFLGGITNFMATAYIIIVNPVIMNASGHGFPINPTITATLITIIIMTTLAGFFVKLPFVIAPGLGLSSVVSYTLIMHDKLPLDIALGVIFWSSLLLLILSITKIRRLIIQAIPNSIQTALSIGIGLFLFLIGIKNANIIIANPNTLLAMSKMNLDIAVCLLGFILTCALLIKRKNYAIVLPIILITVVNFFVNKPHLPTNWSAMPDFSLMLHANLIDSFKFSLIPAILSLFIVNFFDATSSAIGLLAQVECRDEAQKSYYLKRALVTDALSGVVSAAAGTAPGTIFIESAAAIKSGAKTGIAALVSAALFVPFLFLSPLIGLIPATAVSPALMLVGILMMRHITQFDKTAPLEDFIAIILTIVLIPLSFSITTGAAFGILSYTLLKILLGKFKDISFILVLLAIACGFWLYFQ